MKRASQTGRDWRSWAVLALFAAVFTGIFVLLGRQASRDIQADSPEEKTRFQGEFPGLEAAAQLGPERKKRVVEQANRERCSCRCGYTVASCLKLDSRCPLRPANLARVAQLIEEARAGMTLSRAP